MRVHGIHRDAFAVAAVAAAAALATPGAQAQSANCLDFKDKVAARIEETGVRGYALDIVPAGSPVPAGAKSVGNCDGGAFTVLYWRWASSAPAGVSAGPSTPASAAARPTPAPAPAKTPAPTATPAPAPAPKLTPTPSPTPALKGAAAPAPEAARPAPTADSEVQRLSQVPFEFESPASMTVGDSVVVRLAAGAVSPALASGRLVAQLSSPNLKITEIAPAADAPAAAAGTAWSWKVEATEPGAQTLQLTLNADLMVNGVLEHRTVRTFHRTVRVETASTWWPLPRVGAHWPWLLALLLLPVAAFAWTWHARRSAYDEQGLPRGPKIRL